MELTLIILVVVGIYVVLKRKRQRDQLELETRAIGITPDEMRSWGKNTADPSNSLQRDMQFIEEVSSGAVRSDLASSGGGEISATLEEVMRATNRVPISHGEKRYLIRFLKTEERNGLVVRFPPNLSMDDIAVFFDHGLVWLHCPQIGIDVLFVKVSDGTSLFGREKCRFVNYVSEPNQNAFTAGGSHKHIMLALTGINNIFRGHGIVSGMVL